MKMLIYGIDGGDLEIMKLFDMPFLKQFMDENTQVDLTEDLFSRGWVEILTGKHGKHTRGFYMSPVLDGSHRFSTKFSMAELFDDKDIVPLWQLAEQKDVRYCIMNVPTTTPVPKTNNGVVVGSAGGGINKVCGIPLALVSDEETRTFLEKHNYIVDIRLTTSGITEIKELFSRLNEKEATRCKCFIDLCKENSTELGFLVNRGTTIVEYFTRSEIESLSAIQQMLDSSEPNQVHELLKKHFTELDSYIKRLYEELQPEHFIITADHGMVPYKYRGSVTPFLQENGWLVNKKTASSITRLKGMIKKFGLGGVVGKMTKKLAPSIRDSLKEFDWKRSVAFGNYYVSGIYINDQKRFGGPVRKSTDIKRLVSEICEAFNSLEEVKKIGMCAVPYRSLNEDGKFSDCMPDIIFEGNDGIFFDERGDTVIRPNENYGSVPYDLTKAKDDMFTGHKGYHPICLLTKNTAAYLEDSDKRDLTLVYKLVERVLENK
jgi:predicted AlkP superfamily phosphohydrolase/phosphomutase